MGKQRKRRKQKPEKKPSWLVRVFRFFIPKDFKQELERGKFIGMQVQSGYVPPEVFEAVPTFWLGKLLRKIIDPKHKMKFGKEKDYTNGQEKQRKKGTQRKD